MSSMSDRDRKILLAIVPVLVIVAYWFLLLAPKREEAASAKKELTEQQQRLKSARALAAQANGSKTNFAADYGEIVRLGKAIPARVDMPSLLVQLDRAAAGTGITLHEDRPGRAHGSGRRRTRGQRHAARGPDRQRHAGDPGSRQPPARPRPRSRPAARPRRALPAPPRRLPTAPPRPRTRQMRPPQQSGVDATTATSTGGGLPVGGAAGTPAADGTADGHLGRSRDRAAGARASSATSSTSRTSSTT